jgi:membrane protein implicated in regulation of membrane protease activity
MVIIWSVFIAITVIIELATADLVTIWFIVGAIGALIAALLDASELAQIITFVVLSVILLVATRPLTKRMMEKGQVRTNADRFIGMIAIVTKTVTPNEIGEVKVENNLWRAINFDNQSFAIDEKVIITAFHGSKVVISKLQESDIVTL